MNTVELSLDQYDDMRGEILSSRETIKNASVIITDDSFFNIDIKSINITKKTQIKELKEIKSILRKAGDIARENDALKERKWYHLLFNI